MWACKNELPVRNTNVDAKKRIVGAADSLTTASGSPVAVSTLDREDGILMTSDVNMYLHAKLSLTFDSC